MDEKAIREALDRSFDEDELIVLASDCGVDWDGLKGGTKVLRVVSLINYLKRRNDLHKLLGACKAERSNVNWDAMFDTTPNMSAPTQTPLVQQSVAPPSNLAPPPNMPPPPYGRWSVQANDGLGGPGFVTLYANGSYDAERTMLVGTVRAQGTFFLDMAHRVFRFQGWTNTNLPVNETYTVQSYNGTSIVVINPVTGVPVIWTKIG